MLRLSHRLGGFHTETDVWEPDYTTGIPRIQAALRFLRTQRHTRMRSFVQDDPGGATWRPPSQTLFLLLIDEMATAVLLPASFVALCAERFFLTVADGFNPAGADATRGQRVSDRIGPLVAQSQVVVSRAAFVAVSFNREVDVGMLIEERYVGLQRTLLVSAKVGLVVIKVHILDVLAEQVLVRHRRSGRRRQIGRAS